MLCIVNDRYTAQQVLDHEWMKNVRSDIHKEERLSNFNYNSLIEFSKMNRFKKSILSFIANRTNNKDVEKLRDTFIAMDENEDGLITIKELESAFDKLKINDHVDLKSLFEQIDYNKNGFINYTEFLAAMIDEKTYVTEEKLFEAFRMFDKDNSGKISAKEVYEVLHTDEQLSSFKDLIKEVDLDGDGEINYEEFCKMMGKEIRKKKNKLENFVNQYRK